MAHGVLTDLSLLAGSIIVRQSCIIHIWIPATASFTAGGQCFFWYTEYIAQETAENNNF